jgi:tetratricopeptide (TPR) repeat protein
MVWFLVLCFLSSLAPVPLVNFRAGTHLNTLSPRSPTIMEDIKEPQEQAQEQEPVLPFVHAHNRLILLLMIKNESAIIERCLAHATPYVDAIAILDTGSTDDTVPRCEAYLSRLRKPFLVETEPFKNFGHSRTTSFRVAQRLCERLGWDATLTYALAVDADMVIRPQPAFFEFPLTTNGYTVIQENGHMKYYNTRLMKCSHPWTCVGATHEYWSGDPTEKIPYEVFYIDDKNDGGCKADKFERDVRLLTEDLKDDPKNGRTHYYLGQSLKDLGRFDEAIEMFKKRIELGGWVEEVWYAHLQIGRCYDHKGDELLMEYWMNKAFQFHPTRAEPLYHLTRYFRERSQHHKAYHYYLKGRNIPYPDKDVLFIEKNTYEGLFEYEDTILSCYVHPSPHEKLEAQVRLIEYLNRWPHYHQNVFDNTMWYAPPLLGPVYDGTYSRLLLPPHAPGQIPKEYQASSCSLVPMLDGTGYLMNARYVNYTIDDRGCYHMSSPDGHVKTTNALVPLNQAFQPTEFPRFIEEEYQRHPSNIEGLEDLRLFNHDHRLHFVAASKDATPTGKVVMTMGEYDAVRGKAYHVKVLEPPSPSDCQKNWIYVPNKYLDHLPASKGRVNFIYSWHPLQIGSILPEEADLHGGKLHIHSVQHTPTSWTHFRGSSNIAEYNDRLYCVVHHVKYCTPRVYLHALIELNKEMKAQRYTPFFTFRKTTIEYCLGLAIKNDTVTLLASEYDKDPGVFQVPFQKFRWLNV